MRCASVLLALVALVVPARAAVQDLGATIPNPDPWSWSTLLAADGGGGVYACDGDSIYRLVGTTFQTAFSGVAAAAGAGVDPPDFAVSPDGTTAYVTTGMSGRIVEVNLSNQTAQELSDARQNLGMSGNYGTAVDPIHAMPFTTNAWAQHLYHLDPTGNGTLTLLDTFANTGAVGGSFAFTPDGQLIVPVGTAFSNYPNDDRFPVDLYRFSRGWLDDLAAGTVAEGAGTRYAQNLMISGTGAVAADARGHVYMLAQDAIFEVDPDGNMSTLVGDPSRNIWSALFEGEEFMGMAYDAACDRILFGRRTTWFDGSGNRQHSAWGLYAVPEPATLVLLAVGAAAAGLYRRRR